MPPSYDPKYFDELITLEEANFWFINRNKLILWFIKKYAPHAESFLEIGCGTGFVLAAVASSFPAWDICGTELFKEGIAYAEKRVKNAQFLQISAEDLVFKERFDLAGAFDVIEHIEKDTLVLERIHEALKPGGRMILTVPQHKFLWSAADDHAMHKRRYSRKELIRKVEGAGFTVLRATSFVSVLLPLMLLSRTVRKNKDFNVTDEMKIPALMNKFFLGLLHMERICIQLGINFPVGGSLLVMAKKK